MWWSRNQDRSAGFIGLVIFLTAPFFVVAFFKHRDSAGFCKQQCNKDGTTGEAELIFPSPVNLWQIALPVCSQCCTPYLPEGYYQVIQLNLPVGYRARVIDSYGMPMVTSQVVTGDLKLVFFPEPHGISGPVPSSRINALSSASSLAPDQVRYYLVIYPAEGTDPAQTYPLRIQIRVNLREIYLPLVLN